MNYLNAGVSIDTANTFIKNILPSIKSTYNHDVLHKNDFAGLFKLPTGYKNPILVSGTDGVGTKLKLAKRAECYRTLGIDLVAMCVNDILCTGAKPLFFLDYYATSKLELKNSSEIIEGIVNGCLQCDTALIGGETAEMPGVYQDDFDLAGFSVGIVEEDKIIDNSKIEEGDSIIGIFSNGVHANGYSLINKILEDDVHNILNINPFLYKPTKIYVNPVLDLLDDLQYGIINGIIHITGGGLLENIPRVLPEDLLAKICLGSWEIPKEFHWIKSHGNVSMNEMFKTFNCGIGMVLICKKLYSEQCINFLNCYDVESTIIGEIRKKNTRQKVIIE